MATFDTNWYPFGRIFSLIAGILATCAVAPILGFNVYLETFKAFFHLKQLDGK